MIDHEKLDILGVILIVTGFIIFSICVCFFIVEILNMMKAPIPDFMNITSLEG